MGAIDGLAAAMKVKAKRTAIQMDPSNPYYSRQGPLPDPRWDAFAGALQQQEEDAAAEGRHFRVNFGSLRLPTRK